jgi:malate dehydrogenase (oxaloacetate-decarboxylating)(NADP+)
MPPAACLPVTLDVGTNNEALRSDARYLGTRAPRLAGPPWDELAEEFVAATGAVFPGAVVQFEDFNNACAFALLERYRERLCCFNDDIQGTGAMGLAGLYAAGRITGKKPSEQRILFVGAGEACLGIGGTVLATMRREGLSAQQALERCLFFDSRGAVVASRSDLAPTSGASRRSARRPRISRRRSRHSGRPRSSAPARSRESSIGRSSRRWRD